MWTVGASMGAVAARLIAPLEYRTWQAMNNRCHNPSATDYPSYGARGVIVCDRWRNSFENFLADMGMRPQGATLDRFPNNRGNYAPDNCRWATRIEQSRNRAYVKLTMAKAEEIRKLWATGNHAKSELAKMFGVHTSHIHQIIENKMWKT